MSRDDNEDTVKQKANVETVTSNRDDNVDVCVSPQGLLKVAVESARSQDKQNQLERKELKLELERERDARQVLQRQLSSELQTRGETGYTVKLQTRGETGYR